MHPNCALLNAIPEMRRKKKKQTVPFAFTQTVRRSSHINSISFPLITVLAASDRRGSVPKEAPLQVSRLAQNVRRRSVPGPAEVRRGGLQVPTV